ncbi:YSC84-related protein [Albimonas sp. CAU 1670]|uniref:lipid-binding SYLF domain-containing protein n=1 Tax=Albimonas sp. CAU 1670 TaxID=3032599 RepID=UPI0023DCB803|nr:YSC84-related protein [Albimonas sp. CAU 1670]MDF2234374.1 YSC84-related protein [Albimonas sp. CAU 1670]
MTRATRADAAVGPDPLRRRLLGAGLAAAALAAVAMPSGPARAADPADVIDLRVQHSIDDLMNSVAGARELMSRAKGVLIMPSITKAGLLVGGMYGEGALRIGGQSVGYYSVGAASIGLQAGVQKFDQALFFMTTAALENFRRSSGWELAADAEVTAMNNNLAGTVTSRTTQHPVIAVIYGQEGLMAGVSLEGAKYTKLKER